MERGEIWAKGNSMYVYFIRQGAGNGKGPIKIGMASNLERRLNTLQTGNPVELNFIACIPCDSREEARELERKLHDFFRGSKIRGEWFKGGINMARIEQFHRSDTEYIEPEREVAQW